jgi:hypothetical protein
VLTVGAMQLPQPEPLDDLGAFLRGLEPDGGYWLTVRRLADHDHSGGLMGVPVAGAGGGVTSVNGETGAVVLDAADVGALTQAQADLRYALLSAVTALTARVTALETSVSALRTHSHELGTFGNGTLAPTGGIP